MGFKLYDFECECGQQFEELAEENEKILCECGKPAQRIMSAPGLATYSIADWQRKGEILKSRSEKHTREQIVNKEPERWGNLGKERSREGKVQVGYTGKK